MKHQLLMDGREKIGAKELKIQRHSLIIHKRLVTFMNILEGYNPTKKIKVLLVFVDMIVTQFIQKGRKLSISFALITQCYFKVPKRNTLFYHENT